jgi:hypothetical protein
MSSLNMATLVRVKDVIPAKVGIQENTGFPVQARNEKIQKICVAIY